ncbi:zinc ribbon domain-containing protein [Halobacillus sp. KGW1]|uniref:zinc ribbon domain-containing protein n=1 Tax=Halobacillus sp. KGW1 TaxID=1793726 RepID=UPI0007855A2E|nr:zinc ribbon domain-containing protein [Halobacillus sp. KGW1]
METMICHQCRASIDGSASFCTECGTKQEQEERGKACIQCSGWLEKDDAFCTHCGTKQDGQASDPVPSTQEVPLAPVTKTVAPTPGIEEAAATATISEEPVYEHPVQAEGPSKDTGRKENMKTADVPIQVFPAILSVVTLLLYAALIPLVFYLSYRIEMSGLGPFASFATDLGSYIMDIESKILYTPSGIGVLIMGTVMIIVLARLAKVDRSRFHRAMNHTWVYLVVGILPLVLGYFFSEETGILDSIADLGSFGLFILLFPFLMMGLLFAVRLRVQRRTGTALLWFLFGVLVFAAVAGAEVLYYYNLMENDPYFLGMPASDIRVL